MKLTYRGISYNSTNTSIGSLKSDYTAIFRGQSYSIPRPLNIKSPSCTLIYRGIAYSITGGMTPAD